MNRAKLKFSKIITTTSRVSVRNINESARTGGEHHIATGHGLMVQGRLLTTHPGGVHGGDRKSVV